MKKVDFATNTQKSELKCLKSLYRYLRDVNQGSWLQVWEKCSRCRERALPLKVRGGPNDAMVKMEFCCLRSPDGKLFCHQKEARECFKGFRSPPFQTLKYARDYFFAYWTKHVNAFTQLNSALKLNTTEWRNKVKLTLLFIECCQCLKRQY